MSDTPEHKLTLQEILDQPDENQLTLEEILAEEEPIEVQEQPKQLTLQEILASEGSVQEEPKKLTLQEILAAEEQPQESDGGGFLKGLLRRINEPIINVPGVSPAIQSVLPFIRHNITEPIAAAATVPEAPSLLGLAGVPGFQDEFAFNPEQFPGQPEFRERFRENIPAGSRFLAEAGTDPFNLIPGIGFTRLPTRASQIGRLSSSVNVIERGAGQAFGRQLVRELNKPPQLALQAVEDITPRMQLPIEGPIPLGERASILKGPISPVPAEPSLIIVTAQNPLGERLVFAGPRQLRRAAEELGQRSEIQILPGNASAGDVDTAANFIAREVPPSAEVRTPIQRRSGGRDVRPRQTQSQLVGRLDPENLNEMRRSLRRIENEIRTTPPGPRPNSPINKRLRALEEQAEALRGGIRELLAPELPNELDIPGIIRREPVERVFPSSQVALSEPSIRPAGITSSVRPGVEQVARPRPSGIPLDARTPEEAARLRQEVRIRISDEEAEHFAAVARNQVPPDDPAELIQKVTLPEGKPRLTDPPAFAEEVGVGAIRNRAARLARSLATPVEPLVGASRRQTIQTLASLLIRNPVMRGILRWTPGLRNPSLFTENSTQTAGLIRAALIDDGRQKIVGLQAHARKFGNQDDLFGRTIESTGLLESGPFKGRSVNEIAENPSKFSLTSQQQGWLDAMKGLEDEILDFYKRNGISINEVDLVDIERYAGRVHVARVLEDGTIIERGLAGSGGRLTGRTGAQQERVFVTVAEAQKEGFIPLSYEQSFAVRAQSAYNKVVNMRASEWIQANLPSGVELFPIRPFGTSDVRFGERITQSLTDFQRVRVEGPGSQQFIRDLEGMFPDAASSFLRGVNQVNAVQRIFALAGDASLATIQFIVFASRHPVRFSSSMTEFSRSLVGSAINPRANRMRRAQFLVDNAELIQRSPGLILSDSGLEFTEALGRGGFLSPQGLYGGSNRMLRTISRTPGTLAAPLRPFQQAFESAMDDAGVKMMRGLEHLTNGDPLRTRELVDYVNNMRGLSSSARLGLTPNQRLTEAAILLAPRYRRAFGALHASVIQGGLKGDLARKAYMSLTAGVVSTYIGISFALGKIQGKTDEQILRGIRFGLDPSSKQFLLWRAGTTAFGFGSKMTSDLRLLARIFTDPGDVLDFDDFNRNIGVRWVRAQLASTPSDAWDLLMGADYLGEPITRDFTGRPLDTLKSLGKMTRDNVTFLWLQAMAFDGGSKEERIIKGGADFFGLRSYPFPGPSYDDVAQAMFGKDYKDLALPGSNFPSSEQNKVQDEWNEMLTDERRLQREENSDKRKIERKKLKDGIELLPESRKNLENLQDQFQR